MYKNILLAVSILFFVACNNDTSPQSKTSSEVQNTRVGIPTLRLSVVAGGVETSSQIIVNFASTMNESTLTSSNISLEDNISNSVGFTLVTSGSSLTIVPDTELLVNSKYTLTLKQAIQYDTNQTLDKDYTYEIYTRSTTDSNDHEELVLIASTPKDTNNSTSVYSAFSFTFNEDIAVAGVQVLINGDNNTTLIQGKNNLIARPNVPLDYNTTYTIDLVGIQDISSHLYTGQTSFTFKTQEAPSSLNTYDINNSTGNIMVSPNPNVVVLSYEGNSSNELLNVLDINGSQLTFKSTIPSTFSTTIAAAASYNGDIFIASQNNINNVASDFGSLGINRVLDMNISYIYANADFMCVLSKESNTSRFYSLYELSNYQFFQPAYEETGINPLSCYVSTLNSNQAYVSTDTEVKVYTTDPNTTQVYPITPIFEANVTSITANNTHSFFLSDKNITAYSMSSGPDGSFDINVSFTQIRAYENLIYASSANTNEIYIINASTPSAMYVQHIIPTSAIVKNFDFINDKLVAGYATTTLSTAVELFDVSSLNVAPIVEKPISASIIYKSLSSDTALTGYTVAAGDRIVLSENGKEVFSKSLSYQAVNLSYFTDNNGNTSETYIALAQSAQGVELLHVIFDANQTPVDIVSEANITNIGTVNAVFVGEVGFDSNTSKYKNKLLIGSEEKGLLQYDIDTPNNPIYEADDTNFTAISNFTMGYENNASEMVIYISDFGAHDVKRLVYSDYNTSSITDVIPTPSAPRGIHTDYTTGDTFVALGAAGLLAIDGATQQTALLPTPGYAMDVDSAAQYSYDNNGTKTLQNTTILVADFTGTALFSLDSTNGFDINSDFHYNAFIEHSGNIYTTSAIKYNQEIRGAISYPKLLKKSFVLGHYDGAVSTQPYDFNDPVQYIEFNSSTTQPTVSDINDPFF